MGAEIPEPPFGRLRDFVSSRDVRCNVFPCGRTKCVAAMDLTESHGTFHASKLRSSLTRAHTPFRNALRCVVTVHESSSVVPSQERPCL